ncbi:MAG: PEGA domain-containing protein [Candidatus Eiseniibacteriota bacterium]|jgi:hypothetical protein
MKQSALWMGPSRSARSLSCATVVAVACLGSLWLACGQEDPTFSPGGGGPVEQGVVIVTSTPPGATISVGDEDRGTTPDTLTVESGGYRVSVFLLGYFPASDTVMVETDSTRALHFDLALLPTTGSIAVTAPYPADVLLDGTPTGVTAPDTLEGVEPGRHTVRLVLPGFVPDPASVEVEVVTGEVVQTAFELAAPKIVLCEDFSNTGCAPCPAADHELQEVIAAGPAGRILSLNPHVYWPFLGDPYYQFNPVSNGARREIYNVLTAPSIFVDGNRVLADPITDVAIQQLVDGRIGLEPPLAIGVRAQLTGNDYDVAVDVWGVGASIPAELLLFTCVVETETILDPPGPNGQSEYTNVLREILPPPAGNELGGTPLSIAPGGNQRFTYRYVIPDGSIDPGHLAVIAFAQRPDTKEIIQTGTTIRP